MSDHGKLRSYSTSSSVQATLGQWRNLIRLHRQGLTSRVAAVVAELRGIEADVQDHAGAKVEDCRVLDIGPGQHLMQMSYFAARGNHVIGVDRDVIVQGFDPAGYWHMARSNGLGRVAKTAGRKSLGIDRSYRRELERLLGLREPIPRLTVHQRNAWDTRLQAGSFDFVYSLRAFMHIHEPAAAIEEAARVLAPGGVAFIDLMPYTGPNGSLDIRMLGGRHDELAPWAHLRPQHRHLVRESAHLNRLSASEWQTLLTRGMPGCTIRPTKPSVDRLQPLAEELHGQGELLDFSVDDLVTTNLHVFWRKPIARACTALMRSTLAVLISVANACDSLAEWVNFSLSPLALG